LLMQSVHRMHKRIRGGRRKLAMEVAAG